MQDENIITQHLTYEFSILPTNSQKKSFCRILQECADIYNGSLQYARDTWNASGSWEHFENDPNYKRLWYHKGERLNKSNSGFNLGKFSKMLTELRHDPIHGPEWSQTSRAIQKGALNKLEKSMKSFFQRCKSNKIKKGFPRFKPYSRYKSFNIGRLETAANYQFIYNPNKKWGFIKFKGMPGKLRVFLHRPFPENFKFTETQIVKVTENKWKILFGIKIEIPKIEESLKYVAIDSGITNLATYDDGETIQNPRFLEKSEKKIRKSNRSLSRKKKGSNNRKKSTQILAKDHRKISNQRKDFRHKEVNKIIQKAKIQEKGVATEKLLIANMLKNKNLSKQIRDASWGNFQITLEYKASIAGISFMKINPKNTSQFCSQCGNLVPKKLKVKIHNCHNCGLSMDRDQNAAINIAKRAASVAENNLYKRDRSLSQSVKETYR